MKILLDKKGSKGLFIFTDNDFKYVIADIPSQYGNLKIGQEIEYWSNGSYYFTLKNALKDWNKIKWTFKN